MASRVQKFYLFVSMSLIFFLSHAVRNECASHTFFVPRSVTTNSVFELALSSYHHYYTWDEKEGFHFSFYATPFYQHSSKGDRLARYFLRDGNKSLTFNEINEDTNAICSLWFGIESDLNTQFANGCLSISPRRRVYGSYFNLSFAKRWDRNALWFNVAFAAMNARHELRMCTYLKENPGPLSNFKLGTIDQFDSIVNALNNADWNFGKFSCCPLSRGGVDDVQLKLGYDRFFGDESNHVSPYIVGTFPTGKRQKSEFIFEPLVGSKHGSMGAGLNTLYALRIGEKIDCSWLVDLKYRYVFRADQCRSFDLSANGDWSRYLLVVPEDQHLATEPGINLFSGTVEVKPGSTIDFWTALNWQYKACNLEIGYNFWWRATEKIKLKECCATTYGIFDLAGATTVPQSASTANISQSAVGTNAVTSDATFVTINFSDLDLESAAHPAAYSSTVYAAFNWQPARDQYEFFAGIGAQYELAHKRFALEQWAFWGKLGILFDFVWHK